MITIRKASERGHTNLGWLDSYHSFSFGEYRDPEHMGFRTLRVINDDCVAPGKGFGTHPHREMEIVTYVLAGALEHKDSMGNGSIIRPGDVQRMSAGTGVLHSEFNPSDTEEGHFLQIWIFPQDNGIEPGYEQKHFSREEKLGKMRLIASSDGRDSSVTIHQDARIYAAVLEKDMAVEMPIENGRHLWIHVASGEAKLNDSALAAGDGAAVSEENKIKLTGLDNAEVLVFDLN